MGAYFNMFDKIHRKIERVRTFSKPSGLSFIMNDVLKDKQIQAQILDLNTNNQLFEKGVDIFGNDLGDYANTTKQYKQITGQRYDHITLNDTGDFYKSFRFDNQKTAFKISADTIKNGDDLQNMFPNIIGLTDESKEEVISLVKEPFVDTFKRLI